LKIVIILALALRDLPIDALRGTAFASVFSIVLVISVLSWMVVARLVRASFISLKEKEFMKNIMFLARDMDPQDDPLITKTRGYDSTKLSNSFVRDPSKFALTNDPAKIIDIYTKEKEKARLGVVWAKGDAERVISQFFADEYFIKRILILYNLKNKYSNQKGISLYGFYLQLKKRQRLLNCIDRPKEAVKELLSILEKFRKHKAKRICN